MRTRKAAPGTAPYRSTDNDQAETQMPKTPAPSPAIATKINSYPAAINDALFHLREMIYQVASEHDDVGDIEETLKWGQPSYISKNGSTVRIDGNAKKPDQYFMRSPLDDLNSASLFGKLRHNPSTSCSRLMCRMHSSIVVTKSLRICSTPPVFCKGCFLMNVRIQETAVS